MDLIGQREVSFIRVVVVVVVVVSVGVVVVIVVVVGVVVVVRTYPAKKYEMKKPRQIKASRKRVNGFCPRLKNRKVLKVTTNENSNALTLRKEKTMLDFSYQLATV